MTGPHRYQIRVDGHLDDHWAAWLGGVRTTRNHDGTTTLTAHLDHAAVHGLLTNLHNIGATLLSLQTTDTPDPSAPCSR
jgi:hypothetical protein